MVSAERLREVLEYDPDTGIFRWRKNGKIAGCTVRGRQPGYVTIGIDYSIYRAARLAWLYMTGVMPDCDVDHKNRDPSDNAFLNLRLATDGENNRNRGTPKNNSSGVKGVFFYSRQNRWRAQIQMESRYIHLGDFELFADAVHARKSAEKTYFGEFACAADIG